MTKQPSLGTALLAPHGDGPRKGGLNKAHLHPTQLASRGQRASSQAVEKLQRLVALHLPLKVQLDSIWHAGTSGLC